MSDVAETVIEESPVYVTIDHESPQITITNNESNQVSVIQSDTVEVSIAGDTPSVTVNTGAWGSMDISTLTEVLTGSISSLFLNPELLRDITMLQALWARIGNQVELLTSEDAVSITETARTYTDTTITDIAAEINTTTDGKISAEISTITQTANAIIQTVTDFQQEVDDSFTVQNSRIAQTESDIALTVTQLDSIGDDITVLQSSIQQNVNSIALAVSATELVNDTLITTQSELSMLKDSIILAVESIDNLSSWKSATELVLGTDGIALTAMSTSLSNLEYELSTVQTLLNNQWGVTIEEDGGGVKYASGFSLLVHPTWLKDQDYIVDDTVCYDEIIYTCIQDHTASLANYPLSEDGSDYWEENPDGVKSVFNVQAEQFYIQTPSGQTPLFSVDESAVTINTDLVLQVIESVNYGESGESWFKLDATTGLAEFNNITLTLGSGSSGYENLTDKPTSLGDINAAELLVLTANSGTAVFSTTTETTLPDKGTEDTAAIWTFSSDETGGAIIQIIVPDDFDYNLDILFNDENLSVYEQDAGSVTEDTDEIIDLTQTGDTVDLGSLY